MRIFIADMRGKSELIKELWEPTTFSLMGREA